jgi:hypothetical protein
VAADGSDSPWVGTVFFSSAVWLILLLSLVGRMESYEAGELKVGGDYLNFPVISLGL